MMMMMMKNDQNRMNQSVVVVVLAFSFSTKRGKNFHSGTNEIGTRFPTNILTLFDCVSRRST